MPLPECDYCELQCAWIVSNPGGGISTSSFCDEHWQDFITTMASAFLEAMQAAATPAVEPPDELDATGRGEDPDYLSEQGTAPPTASHKPRGRSRAKSPGAGTDAVPETVPTDEAEHVASVSN